MTNLPLELLSPARDLSCALAAINHGADAVYIGGPAFGARAAAGNSFIDIEKLVQAAHRFGVRVYVTMNTLMDDRELEQAVVQAHQLYQIGVDGLIIQDMGLLEADLPPIPLHGSTQMNNRSLEKVVFLEKLGLRQVVLARELSLEQIKTIRAGTSIALEAFVHGALCVSYSGQCYISEVMAGRSANRGECAQFCRHSYTLQDGEGRTLIRDRYLLSLQDLDLSAHLLALIEAGISSFKIEGRLKDENYVKNITAYYRLQLDHILETRPELARSSAGSCHFDFTPDPEKSFRRGTTDYYLNKKRNRPVESRTPKSTGERIGEVCEVGEFCFTVETGKTLKNGDGLCFFDNKEKLVGFRLNRVEAGERLKLYPASKVQLETGTIIYRNTDKAFLDQLKRSEAYRSLELDLHLKGDGSGLQLICQDDDGIVSGSRLEIAPQPARKPGAVVEIAERQLRKCGGSGILVRRVRVEVAPDHFYPASAFNELRRRAFDNHFQQRLASYRVPAAHIIGNDYPWPGNPWSDLANIANTKAAAFYRRHGVRLAAHPAPQALMTCRYCIRHQIGYCLKTKGGKEVAAPLTLSDKTGRYRLDFDCERCEMQITRIEPSE